jgi:hypothetical protein
LNMNDLAAIQATFADYKRIKTRKCAQLIFEIPLELLHETIAKLGGEPSIHQDTWCAIARLDLTADAPNREEEKGVSPLDTSATKPKREMTLANFIGIEIGKLEFQNFLIENYKASWLVCKGKDDKETAKFFVRQFCEVDSLSDIVYDTPEQKKWAKLYEEYQAWLNSSLLKREER